MSKKVQKKSRRHGSRGSFPTRQVFVVAAVLALAAAGIAGAGFLGRLGGGALEQEPQPNSAAAPSPFAPFCQVVERAALVPASGALFGVNLDLHARSLEGYAFDLGHKPAVTVLSTGFPLTDDELLELQRSVVTIRSHGQMMLLTVDPDKGLAGVTAESAEKFAKDLHEFNYDGVPVLVRFGREMNGDWYPWGQQPARYVEAFRTLADAVHANAPGSAMMWTPSYGGGSPFIGGPNEAKPGSPEYAALDTNGDGTVTEDDDSYSPYYPGDDAVDWVGMSLYHWGSVFPWGENELPEPGKFAAQLTGNYIGANGDDSLVPDFYQVYGVDHGKPVAIPETAALFAPGAAGEAELAIKQAWWGQVFDPATAARFPQLKMINWFERDREEPEVKTRVDWTATKAPAVRDAFKAALPDWLRFGPAQSCKPIR